MHLSFAAYLGLGHILTVKQILNSILSGIKTVLETFTISLITLWRKSACYRVREDLTKATSNKSSANKLHTLCLY